MKNPVNELINVLESDIRKWEAIATYFESIGGDITIEGLGTRPGRQHAQHFRGRINTWRILIREIKSSN